MEAVLVGSTEDIKHCLRNSPCVQERNSLGQTALHLAVSSPDKLRILLAHCSNVDTLDKYGTTPLMYAAAYGESQAVLLLLQAGANPWAIDNLNGRGFLKYAIARGHWEMLIGVIDYFTTSKTLSAQETQCVLNSVAFHAAYSCSVWHPAPFQTFMKRGANPNILVEDDGASLLPWLRHTEDVQCLFGAGFKYVNVGNKFGATPLMSFAHYRESSLVAECI